MKIFIIGSQLSFPLTGLLASAGCVVLGNSDEADLTDFVALENELAMDPEGWALLAPFGEHKKERFVNKDGGVVHEKYIQIVDQASVDAVIANENGTNVFSKLKRALVKRPIYRDHPDLKLLAPDTITAGNDKCIPLGVNGGCRKTSRGLEFRPMLAPDGAEAVENGSAKYPSAVFLLKKTGVTRDGGWIEVRPFALASIGLTPHPNISGVDSLANAKLNNPAANQNDNKNTIMKQLLIGWLAAQGIVLANDATDQSVFEAFNKEMNLRTTSITTLGNDKTTLNGTVTNLTGDRTKLVKDAVLPNNLVEAANTILSLGNAKTEADALRKKFIEARVDLAITQGKAPVADRANEILTLENSKSFDTDLENLNKRPVKFQVLGGNQGIRKTDAASIADARSQVLTLANSDPRYKDIADYSKAFTAVLKDHPALAEQLKAKPATEANATAATT